MELYLEDSKNTNAIMFAMATLSPKAAESLDTENYRFAAESDQSEEQYILEDAFQRLIKDIETLGIIFKFDYTDYTNDRKTLCQFLKLCQYILPNILYPKMKSNSILRSVIERIVSGDLGDNNTYLQTYLSEIGGLDNDLPIDPSLTDYADSIYSYLDQTENFSDYFKNLVELYNTEKLSIDSDPETHEAYKNKITDLFSDIIDLSNVFIDDPRYSNIQIICDKIFMDFSNPDNFTEYSYILLHDENTIPEDLIGRYNQKWQYYFMSHPWCYDFHALRHQDVDVNSPLWPVMLVFQMALKKSGYIVDSSLTTVKSSYPNKSDLDLLKGYEV